MRESSDERAKGLRVAICRYRVERCDAVSEVFEEETRQVSVDVHSTHIEGVDGRKRVTSEQLGDTTDISSWSVIQHGR